MNGDNDEQLIESILGEAAMNILSAGAPMSVNMVIKELKRMLQFEQNRHRRECGLVLIEELRTLDKNTLIADASNQPDGNKDDKPDSLFFNTGQHITRH